MAEVSIQYKGGEIASMSTNGTKTLHTSGTYCEGDIVVNYTPTAVPVEIVTEAPTATSGKDGHLFVMLEG